MKKEYKWSLHLETSHCDDGESRYSLTTDSKYAGWNTDSGYNGYGLPKELAEWICKILNKSNEEPPMIMGSHMWIKNEK